MCISKLLNVVKPWILQLNSAPDLKGSAAPLLCKVIPAKNAADASVRGRTGPD